MGYTERTQKLRSPSIVNPEQTQFNVIRGFKVWSRSILHSPDTVRNFFLVQISAFIAGHSPSFVFSKSSPDVSLATFVLADEVSRVGRRDKIGHPALSHKRIQQVPGRGR